MQHLAYLAALLFAITCIALTDYRYKLAFFNDWRRSCRTMGMALVFFIVWDVAGIGLTIFFEGSSRYTTGIFLAPH
ncbi:MAG: lycopene cyclase domain-containing protein, partial [Patescibacteria group bacterium]|nr:lycopene cyclase domain-containing protein [Patescibacteria group bacterium]